MVPVPNLATGTVPDAMFDPLRLVNDAPEPLNVVAVATPETERPSVPVVPVTSMP